MIVAETVRKKISWDLGASFKRELKSKENSLKFQAFKERRKREAEQRLAEGSDEYKQKIAKRAKIAGIMRRAKRRRTS